MNKNNLTKMYSQTNVKDVKELENIATIQRDDTIIYVVDDINSNYNRKYYTWDKELQRFDEIGENWILKSISDGNNVYLTGNENDSPILRFEHDKCNNLTAIATTVKNKFKIPRDEIFNKCEMFEIDVKNPTGEMYYTFNLNLDNFKQGNLPFIKLYSEGYIVGFDNNNWSTFQSHLKEILTFNLWHEGDDVDFHIKFSNLKQNDLIQNVGVYDVTRIDDNNIEVTIAMTVDYGVEQFEIIKNTFKLWSNISLKRIY